MRNSARLTLPALFVFALACVLAFEAPAPAAQRQRKSSGRKVASRYTCPMHPEVKSGARGRCPKCGMFLTPAGADGGQAADVTAAEPAKGGASVPGAGLHIPDTTVYDQDGRRLNFYTDLVKGRTVAVNFIFTTCTTICPPMAVNFRRVQQELSGRDVELISVSVDPATDVPERLKGFAAKFNAGPGWTFVTGGKTEIDQLLRALGALTANKNDHTPMILVGNDATNHWTRIYGLAKSSELVKVINDVAEGKANGPSVKESPKR